jgi:hypothetical protein
MIGRKLSLIKAGRIEAQTEGTFEIPYLKEAQHLTVENIKKYEHMTLVALLRFYVQSTNILKETYRRIKNNISNTIKKSHINPDRAEISKLLKMISNYTHRVKEIKHKIKEEEKSL